MHLQGDIAFRFRTKQRVTVVYFNICKKLTKLIGYHNNVTLATVQLMSVL